MKGSGLGSPGCDVMKTVRCKLSGLLAWGCMPVNKACCQLQQVQTYDVGYRQAMQPVRLCCFVACYAHVKADGTASHGLLRFVDMRIIHAAALFVRSISIKS